MSKKKENKVKLPSFNIKDGAFKGTYQITVPSARIEKIGVVKAVDLVKMPEVLQHLIGINSGIISKID